MKRFREVTSAREQVFLLPVSVNEFVEVDAPVRVLVEVVERLDVGLLEARHKGGGAPAYAPRMLLSVLLLAYTDGLRSSRRIENALKSDVRYMYASGMSRPDYRTIARFRKENETALKDLFVQVVHLCQSLGLVLMEHAAVDGTKIRADVSGRETYSRDRLERTLGRVKEEVAAAFSEAEAADQAEDAAFGDKRGDEIPEDLKDAQSRKERLEKALAEMDRLQHAAIPATDTEARVMKTKDGNRAAYNAQAVVDRERQVIVAAEVCQDCTDQAQLCPMVEAAARTTGAYPQQITADCGYHSVGALAYVEEKRLDAYLPGHGRIATRKDDYTYDAATDTYLAKDGERLTRRNHDKRRGKDYVVYRGKRGTTGPFHELYVRVDGQRQQKMADKMESEAGQAVYRYRQQVVEPVFGHLKTRFGLNRFLLRGRAGANCEFLLAAIAHNIEKIRRYAANTPAWAL